MKFLKKNIESAILIFFKKKMSPFPDYVHIFCFQNYASILKKSEHIIRYFSVRNSMIPRLDDHLFMGMKIEHLYIHDCSKYSFSLN